MSMHATAAIAPVSARQRPLTLDLPTPSGVFKTLGRHADHQWRNLVRRGVLRQAMQQGQLALGSRKRPLDIHSAAEALTVLEDQHFEAADLGLAVALTLDRGAAWALAERLMSADRRHALTVELIDDANQSEGLTETVTRLAGLGIETRVVLDGATASEDRFHVLVDAGATDVVGADADSKFEWMRLAYRLPRRPIGRG